MSSQTPVESGARKEKKSIDFSGEATYRMEIPRFIQGVLKEKDLALADVMEMSAMQKSATSSSISPNIPFQCPGEISLPYFPSSTSLNVKLNPRTADSSLARSIANPSNLSFPESFS